MVAKIIKLVPILNFKMSHYISDIKSHTIIEKIPCFINLINTKILIQTPEKSYSYFYNDLVEVNQKDNFLNLYLNNSHYCLEFKTEQDCLEILNSLKGCIRNG